MIKTLAVLSSETGGTQVARGLIGAVVVGHYPLNQHPARLALEDVENYFLGWRHLHAAFSSFQTIVFVMGSLGIGILVSPHAAHDIPDIHSLVRLWGSMPLPKACFPPVLSLGIPWTSLLYR